MRTMLDDMATTGACTAAFVCLVATACHTEGLDGKAPPSEGFVRTPEGWTFRTSALAVEPGQERYLCYAATAAEDLHIHRFRYSKTRAIHHFMFAQALAPEQEGVHECDFLFQTTWAQLFTATTADAELTTPTGSAKLLPKGTELVLQAHLLNTTTDRIVTTMEIEMTASPDRDPEPVGLLGFGSANIDLPPGKVTTVESTCRLDREARLYAIVPHMHYLGRRIELDFGSDDASLTTGYVRDPFSFDDQHFDTFERTLAAGTVARLRCTYDNTTANSVFFGESSRDEMCIAAGFVVGRGDLELCTQASPVDGGVPRAPDAGVCGVAEGDSGIGRLCTKGGGECDSGLFCSADYLDMPGGICFRVGCLDNADCAGATCCELPNVAGLANVCVPEACRPSTCIPVGGTPSR